MLLHTCQVITPDNNIATVFKLMLILILRHFTSNATIKHPYILSKNKNKNKNKNKQNNKKKQQQQL